MSDQPSSTGHPPHAEPGGSAGHAVRDAPSGLSGELVAADGLRRTGHPAEAAEFVIAACARAALLLREVVQRGDIPTIAELRSQAEAVRVYTEQKHLGADAELAAAEIVRRAERGLAQAVRRGQEAGQVGQVGDGGWRARELGGTGDTRKISSGDVLGRGRTRTDTYALFDGVTDQDFEDALDRARAEGSLVRASLVRQVRQRHVPARHDDRRPVPARHDDGKPVPEPGDASEGATARRVELVGRWAGQDVTSRRMGWWLGISRGQVIGIADEHGIAVPADAAEMDRKRPRIDPNTVVRQTVAYLTGFADSLERVDPGALDPAQTARWASAILAALPRFEQFARSLTGKTDD